MNRARPHKKGEQLTVDHCAAAIAVLATLVDVGATGTALAPVAIPDGGEFSVCTCGALQ